MAFCISKGERTESYEAMIVALFRALQENHGIQPATKISVVFSDGSPAAAAAFAKLFPAARHALCLEHSKRLGKSNKTRKWLHGNKTALVQGWFDFIAFMPPILRTVIWRRYRQRINGENGSVEQLGKAETLMVAYIDEYQIPLQDDMFQPKWASDFKSCSPSFSAYTLNSEEAL